MLDTSRSVHPRPISRRFRTGAATALAAIVLVVGGAACSSDEPNASTTTSAPGTEDAGGGSTSTPGSTPTTDDGGAAPGTTVPDAEHGPLPAIELDEREQAYVDALMKEPPEGMDDEQATCIAGQWVQAIGVDTIEAAGVTPESIEAGTASINDIPADRATAEVVVDAYEACEFDLTDLVISGFSSMAQGDPAKMACLEAAVTVEVAREYMILAVMASATDGNPDLVEIQRVIEPCLA